MARGGRGLVPQRTKEKEKRPKSQKGKKKGVARTSVPLCLSRHAPTCHETWGGVRYPPYIMPTSWGHDMARPMPYNTGRHVIPCHQAPSIINFVLFNSSPPLGPIKSLKPNREENINIKKHGSPANGQEARIRASLKEVLKVKYFHLYAFCIHRIKTYYLPIII